MLLTLNQTNIPYNSKEDVGYVWDTARVFNNLYSEGSDEQEKND